MAYNAKALRKTGMSFVGAADTLNAWLYATNDARATVEAANYFTDKRLKKGDMIVAVMARSGTPVIESYVITAYNSSYQATIARESATGLTDSTGGTTGSALALAAVQQTVTLPVQLADLATGTFKVALPFAFKCTAALFRTAKPASTAAKAATLTVGINGVAVTGGVIALTSANQNAIGGTVAGSAITALNTGTAGQTLEVAASAVTAFVEGDGYVEFTVTNLDLANALASLNAA